MTRGDDKTRAEEWAEFWWNEPFIPGVDDEDAFKKKQADFIEQAFRAVREDERERCLDWIMSERWDCGCADRIAAAIRDEGEGE